MVGVAQLVEHLVVVQVVAGSSPVTHPTWFEPLTGRNAVGGSTRSPLVGRHALMGHNGPVMSGNKRSQRFQRITVGVIALTIAVSLALSLVSGAFAATMPSERVERPTAAAPGRAASSSPTPEPVVSSRHGGSTAKPHTKTPQGQATQVTDGEHIGGLVGFIAFMLGGVLLLIRGRRRNRVRQS